MVAEGQNYIGLSQSKIIKRYGNPDITGANYFVYVDQAEEGTNTYFFDSGNNCNAFVISRKSNYFADYQKMLEKNFIRTLEYTYISKSENLNFKAEIAKSPGEFQICITYKDDEVFHAVQNVVEN